MCHVCLIAFLIYVLLNKRFQDAITLKGWTYISHDVFLNLLCVNRDFNSIFTFARVDLLEKRNHIVDSLSVRYRVCASARRRIRFLLCAAKGAYARTG